jgi:hypothetical protein
MLHAVAFRCLLVLGLALGAFVSVGISRAEADAGATWTAGPNAVGDNTFAGAIDSPSMGRTLNANSRVVVQGWVVDQTAVGWTGVDQVSVYLGLQDQGGTLLATASVAQPRPDVAGALGNAFWANAGFTAVFDASNLGVGPSQLTVYAHTPDRGSWYRQVLVQVPAAPAMAYADDPLLVVRIISPSSGVNDIDVDHTINDLDVEGYAIDRNLPASQQLGIGGSGVSRVQFYLDGPRGSGEPLGDATLGQKNREATGFGARFLMSGWQLTLHPNHYSVDRHEFYVYALSAFTSNESLVVVPLVVQ